MNLRKWFEDRLHEYNSGRELNEIDFNLKIKRPRAPKVLLNKEEVRHHQFDLQGEDYPCGICGTRALHHVQISASHSAIHLCTHHFSMFFRVNGARQKPKKREPKEVAFNEFGVRRIELKQMMDDPLVLTQGQKIASVEISPRAIPRSGAQMFISLYVEREPVNINHGKYFLTITTVPRNTPRNHAQPVIYDVTVLDQDEDIWMHLLRARETYLPEIIDTPAGQVSRQVIDDPRSLFSAACRELMEQFTRWCEDEVNACSEKE